MKRVVALFAGVVLTGCTFIDQKVEIQPQLDGPLGGNLGNGKQVGLRVVDEREDFVLGKRGTGMVEGAKITTEQDVRQLFADSIAQGLRQSGFLPILELEGAPTAVRVEIRSLQYDVSMGLWTGSNMGKASIKVLANNAGKTYGHVYRGQKEIRTMWVASQETNAKIINGAVSDVLRNMFATNNSSNSSRSSASRSGWS
jgi:uncharacterized lipoprotein YajG